MSILAPILVTLVVAGVAVALAARDAAGLRARADGMAYAWSSGRAPSGWHPVWWWRFGPRRDVAVSRSWPGGVPRVVSVEACDVPAGPGPVPALQPALQPALVEAARVVAADGSPVHVVTGVGRWGRTVPDVRWFPPHRDGWGPSTRCEREPFVGPVPGDGRCCRCVLRRGHPGGCVPERGAS